MHTTYETYIQSPVGVLQLVQTADVISAIHFIDEPGDVTPEQYHTDVLEECAMQIRQYFEGIRQEFTFPMLQAGTDFQQKVWNKLEQIPFGRTISYMQLAIRLGDPKCIRAAGTANGRNNIAIVVPCHRVIGNNGSLVGYAGGLSRKQWLLEHEAKLAHGVRTLF